MTNISICSGAALADCRPKGGNASSLSRQSTTYPKTLQSILSEQWNYSQPHWFITIQWTPAAPNYATASSHSRLFRNRLLTTIYGCRLNQIPDANNRRRLVWFHERAQDPSGRIIYHSHLHLTEIPAPYSTQQQLDF